MSDQATLGDVLFDIQAGKSFQTAEILARPDELGVLKVSAVTWSKFQPDEAKALNGEYMPDDSHRVRKGDLLMSRANTKEFVGAVVLVDRDYPCRLLSDKTLRLVIDEDRASKEYLLFALRAPKARRHIEHYATGTSDSMRNIAQGVIRAVPIDLPPVTEQRRCAARLSAQLAEVEAARQAVQAQYLVAWSLKSKALEASFEKLGNWKAIGTAAKLQSGYAFKSEAFKTSGVRLLRNTNILPGKVYWDETVYLSEEDARRFPAYELAEGDVLISLDRPVISSGVKVARVSDADLPALLLQRVGRFMPISYKLDQTYLFTFLQTDRFITAISGHEQSVGVPHISPAQVEAIEIPIPDLETQKRHAERMKTIVAEWSTAVGALQRQLDDLAVLEQRLLAQAFEN